MQHRFSSFLRGYTTLACLAFTLFAAVADTGSSILDTIRSQHADVKRIDLNNGMTCLLKADHSAPVASIQFWVGTGAIHEEEFLGSGLSHAVEHMIFNGTPTRSANDITREIDQAGGRINAYTTLDRTVFYTEIPASQWKVGFDALADSLMHASFPQEQWDQERLVILREFAMGYDDPNRVLNKLLWRTVYRTHPYRVPTIGFEDVFSARTRDDLATFFARNYVPDNMTLVIVGDLDLAAVEAEIRTTLTPFTRQARAPVVLPEEPAQLTPREARITGDYNVGRLVWCYRTVPLTHPDAAALDVLAYVAGHGRSSRLVQEIQETQQLCSEISAWSFTPQHDGLFGVSTTFAPESESDLRAAIEAQIKTLATIPFSEEEVSKARRQLLMGELNDLRTMQGQASSLASGQFFTGDFRFGERYLEQLSAINSTDLQRVARTYLVDETRTVVLLTPETESKETPNKKNEAIFSPAVLTTLSNGVRVITRTDTRLPLTSACIALAGGLRSEPANKQGMTALLADLLTRGTPTHDAESFATKVETLGASLSPFSGLNSLGMRIHGLDRDMPQLLTLAADALKNATFPPEEIVKQREIQLAHLRRQQEQPMYHAQRQLEEAIYAGHPYARERLGTEASLHTIDTDDLIAYRNALLNPTELVIALAGNITPLEATKLAAACFETLSPREATPSPTPTANPELPGVVTKHMPREQAIVIAGFPGVAVTDPRADALAILEQSMSGLASTLGESVRGEHALAYFVGAYSRSGIDPGLYAIYAGTQAAHAQQVADLFAVECERVRTEGLSTQEIERATRQLIAAHEMSQQNSSSVAMKAALNELYGLGHDYDDSLARRLNAVTQEELMAAAALLAPETRTLSFVLPAE